MRIAAVTSRAEAVPLVRPYVIASRAVHDVDLAFVEIRDEGGRVGYGSASPAEEVTGESFAATVAALAPDRLGWLVGRDLRHLGGLSRVLAATMRATPAARAAVEIALFDLAAGRLGVPLVELLGRCHEALPTSITIGIKGVDETAEEAAEYLGRGFRHLKVKIGLSYEEDAERLVRLRERFGSEVGIRVDANRGYDRAETEALGILAERLDLELIEQPLPRGAEETLRGFPEALRRRIAADESLLDERDALALAAGPACGIFNIKIMKCGGVTPGLAIAGIAEAAGTDLMWGCNDESVVSLAAALHVAFASPRTRWLDLDGAFDLARDPFVGGFVLEDGVMRTVDAPGLGVRPRE